MLSPIQIKDHGWNEYSPNEYQFGNWTMEKMIGKDQFLIDNSRIGGKYSMPFAIKNQTELQFIMRVLQITEK